MTNENLEVSWQTHAEATAYRETPSYDETIAYAKQLASASPLLKFVSFGLSGQGREIPLLIASESGDLDPGSAHQHGKAIVLVQACIHAGEPDGKDAVLALLRDIFIEGSHRGILQNVVLLFIPIYNTDGHERSSPYNRINQNGPADMGWRTTSTYQNLNRDYMKADTPETRAWLQLWNEWQPHLFIDCHVTDGADYRSVITYHHERHAGVSEEIVEWENEIFGGRVKPATAAAGHAISWYLEFIDNRDLTLGTRDFNGSPRFSTGYTPLRNRPGILIETHMIKDYESRVRATYDFLRLAITEVNRDAARLRDLVRTSDDKSAQLDANKKPFPIQFELTDVVTPFAVKAYTYETEHSDVSDDLRVVFGKEPLDLTVPMYEDFAILTAIVPPQSYIVPRQWQDVIDVLRVHGVQLSITHEAMSFEVEQYRFVNTKWPDGPFEGRLMPSFEVEEFSGTRVYPAGSAIVPVAQKLRSLVINLLEPLAPDSFARWGFFNAIFEQKEYGEAYVIETLAREMMRDDMKLKKEFENRLRSEEEFAKNPALRLEFFYKKSPYWDPEMNLYPIGRIK